MKIKYSALVMGVSGKLNGSVGATNKGGAYLRNKGVTKNPNTPAQALVRSRFGSLSSQFRSLTPAQISAWNTAAETFPIIDRLGDTRYLTGLGLYVQLNTNLLSVGAATISDPPIKQAFPAVHILTLDAVYTDAVTMEVDINITFDAAVAAGKYAILAKTVAQHSPSITNVKNQLRGYFSANVAAGSTAVFPTETEYRAKFGSIVVGQMTTVEFVLVSLISGEASASFKISEVTQLV